MEADYSVPERKAKKGRGFRWTDALILLIILVIITILGLTLMKQLALRHEVSGARKTSDQLITAMQKQDGKAARDLGDASFQAKNKIATLDATFKQSKPYIVGTPIIVKQTADNGKANKVVSFYYKFNDKKPFYVRTTVIQPNGTSGWHIINFSGNASLDALTK